MGLPISMDLLLDLVHTDGTVIDLAAVGAEEVLIMAEFSAMVALKSTAFLVFHPSSVAEGHEEDADQEVLDGGVAGAKAVLLEAGEPLMAGRWTVSHKYSKIISTLM